MFRESSALVSVPETLAAPVKGLNVIDSLLAMDPLDAITLNNMTCEPYGLRARLGSKEWATNLGGSVDHLMGFNDATPGSSKIFACVATALSIFDISVRGDYVAAVAIYSGLTNVLYVHVNFANVAGSHLIAVNGTDDPIWYGDSGTQRLVAGGGGFGTISGVNPNTFIHVCIHQRRLWFAQSNSTSGWFLPVDAVYGVVTEYNFGPLFRRGGHLVGIYTWTVDSGSGPDDLLVAISSEGEALVFAGTDPATEGLWAMVGNYYVSPPIGRNFGNNFGGDLILLTEQGAISMNRVITSKEPLNPKDFYSYRVQRLLASLTSTYSSTWGWQIVVHPNTNLALINVPSSPDKTQIVVNTSTGGWSTFTDWEAVSWEIFQREAYFGTSDGVVYKALTGFPDLLDLNDENGTEVKFEVQQAFNSFKSAGHTKYFSMMRPSVLADSSPQLVFGVNTDYVLDTVYGAFPSAELGDGAWDSGVWNTALWGADTTTFKEWQSVGAVGHSAGIRMRGICQSEVVWVSTDWIIQPGGLL